MNPSSLNIHLGSSVDLAPNTPDPIDVDPCDFARPYFTEGNGENRIGESGYLINFRKQLGVAMENETTGNPEWYFMMVRAWHLLHSDSIIITDEDADVLTGLVTNTTLNAQFSILDAIHSNALDDANELNSTFTPLNEFDQNTKEVLSIYLSAVDDSGFLHLNAEDSTALLGIALQRAFESGPAVHMARGMLDTIIDFSSHQEQENKLIRVGNALVYPNPAFDLLAIQFIGVADIVDITITNVVGEIITRSESDVKNNTTHFNIAFLPPGIYFYKLTNNNHTLAKGYFVKQ